MKYRIAKKIAADKPRSGQLRDVRHRLDAIARAVGDHKCCAACHQACF